LVSESYSSAVVFYVEINVDTVHVSPKAVTMTPGNPDSITHAFAAEDKKANELMEKMKKLTQGLGVSDLCAKFSSNTEWLGFKTNFWLGCTEYIRLIE
jgi:hypothetical protein